MVFEVRNLLVLLSLLFQVTVSAEPPPLDPQLATADEESGLSWYDAQLLPIEGQAWPASDSQYVRLPAKAKRAVRKDVWDFSRHSSGMLVRFLTDATRIHARWELLSETLARPHMPATGASGVDLYVRDTEGEWRWLACPKPRTQSNSHELVSGIPAGRREYMLYLPLYNGVLSLEIGIPRDRSLFPAPERPLRQRKPIVFYGTSITHGACASRPGMTHSAILGRQFERPIINLGFSGNGRLETEVAELISEIDAAVYVLDCLPNLRAEGVAKNTEPCIDILRKAHPDTPILLVEDRSYSNAFLVTAKDARNQSSRAALRKVYDQLKKAGDENLYYLEGDHLLGEDNEGTVDGSHPTDLGFVRQADAFAEVLGPILADADLDRAAQRSVDFGKQWVRSKPFPQMGLTMLTSAHNSAGRPFDFEQYKRQNYSILLAWRPREELFREASRAGSPWMLNLRTWDGPTEEFQQQFRDLMKRFPGCVGLMVNDEPTLHGRGDVKESVNTFENTGKVLDWVRSQRPDLLVLSNTAGAGGGKKHYFGVPKDPTPDQLEQQKKYGFSEFISDYVRIVRPDVLMFDTYIFKYGEGNESGVSPYWYQSLWVIRREAQRAGIPYWAWMQTWDRPKEGGGYNVRLPSESDYRMNVFSALTYGFQGFADFTYCGIHKRDLLLKDGTPSPLFEPAARVHAEVAQIGRSLRFLTSTNIAFLPGNASSRKPQFIDNWSPGAGGDNRIRSIEVLDGDKYRKGLIGHFADDAGQKYFMITNLYQHAHKTAEEGKLRIAITFDPQVKTILRLSRETGEVERLNVDPNGRLTITLPGGTGDLLKYDDGPFVGL